MGFVQIRSDNTEQTGVYERGEMLLQGMAVVSLEMTACESECGTERLSTRGILCCKCCFSILDSVAACGNSCQLLTFNQIEQRTMNLNT